MVLIEIHERLMLARKACKLGGTSAAKKSVVCCTIGGEALCLCHGRWFYGIYVTGLGTLGAASLQNTFRMEGVSF